MYGWRIDAGGRSAAFVTDCKTIPPSTLDRLRGLDLMVLDALRPEPHPTHLSLSESAAFLGKIAAKRSFVVHLCHAVSHAAADSLLPPSVHPARDGLVLDF
jgi:phosphoribosyl 1,2-cyclic phosphate phosphodiesterase